MEERFSPYNVLKSQLEGALNDIERMTSGNFMHHKASASMLIKSALKEVDKVVNAQREKDIKETCAWMRNNLEDDFDDCHDIYIVGSLEENINEYMKAMKYGK